MRLVTILVEHYSPIGLAARSHVRTGHKERLALWWRNGKTRPFFQDFPTCTTTNHQLPTPDDNNWVTRINRESSL